MQPFKEDLSAPERNAFVRDDLVLFSESPVTEEQNPLEELAYLRTQMSTAIGAELAPVPVRIYLFDDESAYREYLKVHVPTAPDRRALFVKVDTELAVYAYRNEWLNTDLRHEVAHCYLHGSFAQLPLWLDEGLAEYFEATKPSLGFNQEHLSLLQQAALANAWQPELMRLEQIQDVDQFGQLEYAESWAWISWLLSHSQETRALFASHLQQLRQNTAGTTLAMKVLTEFPDSEMLLRRHLAELSFKAGTLQPAPLEGDATKGSLLGPTPAGTDQTGAAPGSTVPEGTAAASAATSAAPANPPAAAPGANSQGTAAPASSPPAAG